MRHKGRQQDQVIDQKPGQRDQPRVVICPKRGQPVRQRQAQKDQPEEPRGLRRQRPGKHIGRPGDQRHPRPDQRQRKDRTGQPGQGGQPPVPGGQPCHVGPQHPRPQRRRQAGLREHPHRRLAAEPEPGAFHPQPAKQHHHRDQRGQRPAPALPPDHQRPSRRQRRQHRPQEEMRQPPLLPGPQAGGPACPRHKAECQHRLQRRHPKPDRRANRCDHRHLRVQAYARPRRTGFSFAPRANPR